MNNDENNMLYDDSKINSTPSAANSSLDNNPILECRNLVKTYSNSAALL